MCTINLISNPVQVCNISHSVHRLFAGDLSSTVSVICFTTSLTATGSSLTGLESGSDYISRGKTNSYRVVFPQGVTEATCDVKVKVKWSGLVLIGTRFTRLV